MNSLTKEELKSARFELRDILITHDIELFRKFLEQNSPKIDGLETVVGLPDEKLSDLMHTLKAHQIHFGADWQQSRNYFRLKKFAEREEEFPNLVTEDVKEFQAKEACLPLCSGCVLFRTPPSGEQYSCMHRGGSPEDVACIGWTKLPQNQV